MVLIGTEHVFIEDICRDLVNERVCNPSSFAERLILLLRNGIITTDTIMTGSHFAQLVSSNLVHCFLVRLFITLDRDLCRHSTHCRDLAPVCVLSKNERRGVAEDVLVAGLDEQSHICIHESDFHRHVFAIWHNSVRIRSAFLDEREDVIPSGTKNQSRRREQHTNTE